MLHNKKRLPMAIGEGGHHGHVVTSDEGSRGCEKHCKEHRLKFSAIDGGQNGQHHGHIALGEADVESCATCIGVCAFDDRHNVRGNNHGNPMTMAVSWHIVRVDRCEEDEPSEIWVTSVAAKRWKVRSAWYNGCRRIKNKIPKLPRCIGKPSNLRDA